MPASLTLRPCCALFSLRHALYLGGNRVGEVTVPFFARSGNIALALLGQLYRVEFRRLPLLDGPGRVRYELHPPSADCALTVIEVAPSFCPVGQRFRVKSGQFEGELRLPAIRRRLAALRNGRGEPCGQAAFDKGVVAVDSPALDAPARAFLGWVLAQGR